MRITPDGEVSDVGDPVYFANGLTIIDGRTLVIAESFGNRLSAFDILEDDQPSERRDWATFGPLPSATGLQERSGELVVAPDGISNVDAEGAIWVADFTKTVASRVLPGGEIAQQVSTGDLNCFAAALGGADGRTLFLCAATDELDSNVHRANRERRSWLIASLCPPLEPNSRDSAGASHRCGVGRVVLADPVSGCC
jgi:sugar lactone lactonase YvrE